MASIRPIEHLEPVDLVRAARSLVERVFVEEYGHTPWLAIELPAGDEALAEALRAVPSIVRASEMPPPPLEFHTDLVALEDLNELGEPDRPSTVPERNIGSLSELGQGSIFFRAVRKRLDTAGALGERVSIGRAMNQDIVLRHPRVSKFHAFFITKAGDWSIADAGSTNGTTVNGVRLAPRKPALLRSGDQVGFGPIQTAFLDATLVWRLLRAK